MGWVERLFTKNEQFTKYIITELVNYSRFIIYLANSLLGLLTEKQQELVTGLEMLRLEEFIYSSGKINMISTV